MAIYFQVIRNSFVISCARDKATKV